MKKFFLSFLLLVIVLASSCSQEEIVQQQIASMSENIFVASFEQNDSRTYLEYGKYLRWTANDELSIFMGKTLNRQFRFIGETGDNSGGFEEVSSPGFVTGNNLDNPCHYAVYPYNKSTKISETGILTINLPSEQAYAKNSFGLGDNTMVAVTSSLSDMELSFKNVCGYLKFKLYGNDVTVRSVTVQSNGGEKLSGSATLTAANGKNPALTMSSTASDMITLDCGKSGVTIGSAKEEATEFWFVLPETSFSQGFTLTVTGTNGNSFVKTTSKNIVVERNVIKPISAMEVVIDNTPTYHVETAGTLSSLIGDDLKYSLTSLKLTGELSSADISLIRNMAGSDYLGNETEGKLVELDLSEASIVTENNNSFYYMDFNNQTYSTNANEIGKYMFYKTKLESILLPGTITNIGFYAFGYTTNLSRIILPNGIKEIPYGAFRESGITSIVIPEGVEMIDTDAFYKCYGLQSVTLPNTLKCLNSFCFACSGITSLTIPSSVNTIEMYVLAHTNQLSEVIVLDGELKELPNHFLYNSAVSSVSIPGNVQKIGDSAFQECANLKSIIIPEGVQSIGSYSFKNSGLMEVVIPSSVKSISTEAFSAAKLAEIHCLSKTSPVADTYTFVYDYNAEWENRITLYVPKGCSNIYKANSPWKYFKNIVEE